MGLELVANAGNEILAMIQKMHFMHNLPPKVGELVVMLQTINPKKLKSLLSHLNKKNTNFVEVALCHSAIAELSVCVWLISLAAFAVV
jgi:hypothetical protein